jgi:hypothetical protein
MPAYNQVSIIPDLSEWTINYPDPQSYNVAFPQVRWLGNG